MVHACGSMMQVTSVDMYMSTVSLLQVIDYCSRSTVQDSHLERPIIVKSLGMTEIEAGPTRGRSSPSTPQERLSFSPGRIRTAFTCAYRKHSSMLHQ
jgi:hypothetical protein